MAKEEQIHFVIGEINDHRFSATFPCSQKHGKFTYDLDKVTCGNCKRTKKYKLQVQMNKCADAIAEAGIVV